VKLVSSDSELFGPVVDIGSDLGVDLFGVMGTCLGFGVFGVGSAKFGLPRLRARADVLDRDETSGRFSFHVIRVRCTKNMGVESQVIDKGGKSGYTQRTARVSPAGQLVSRAYQSSMFETSPSW
jgi:hypothetical protein